MKKGIKILAVFAIFITLITGGCGSSPSASGPDELDLAIREASDYLNGNIPQGSMIVILNVQSDSAALSDYIIDELIANAVNDRIFKVVDRQQLDLIRTEQNFQLSGEVDDDLALSIGKFLGAQTIVSGRVSQVGDRYRITIRALDVQTAQVQGQYNRNLAAGKTITALMRSGGSSGRGTQTTTTRTTGSNNTGTGATAGTTVSGSSGTGTISGTTRVVPTITSITVSPDSVSVGKGRTQQFSATVSGTNDPDLSVTWTVTGNTSSRTSISGDGILTVAADETITPLTVIATSTLDRTKNGSATVEVPGGIAALNVNNAASWNAAVNRIRNGGNNQTYSIVVTGTVSVPSTQANENLFGSVSNLTVTIQGGGTLSLSTNGNLLSIGAGQTIITRNITLRGRSGNNSPIVRIMGGGIFRMEDNASVTGNTSGSNGGGVLVNGGTFIMLNGSISGNTTNGGGSGGGVCVDNGTFMMQGGSISGNTGSGVYIVNGNFNMEGGTISSNTASSNGGGVCIVGGTFAMQGGTVSGNTSGYVGGGVHVNYNGTFTMRSGIVSGNNANENGGGVYVYNGTFTKTGGTITGSDAPFGDRNSSKQGHALHIGNRWRNATAGPDDNTGGYGFWTND